MFFSLDFWVTPEADVIYFFFARTPEADVIYIFFSRAPPEADVIYFFFAWTREITTRVVFSRPAKKIYHVPNKNNIAREALCHSMLP